MGHWTDKPNPEFEKWWATKTAKGYQYGREALENVRFGFEGAQSIRWQPIKTCPDNTTVLFWDQGPRVGRMEHGCLRMNDTRQDHFWGDDGFDDNKPPTYWTPY